MKSFVIRYVIQCCEKRISLRLYLYKMGNTLVGFKPKYANCRKYIHRKNAEKWLLINQKNFSVCLKIREIKIYE